MNRCPMALEKGCYVSQELTLSFINLFDYYLFTWSKDGRVWLDV